MKHHLIVVEGAHDAAFFGKLLRRRGFSEVVLLGSLAEPWHGLVPTKFPVRDDGRLDKIIVYPNVYSSQDKQTWVGIAISGGGEDKIIESLRAPIELNSAASFSSIGIIIDADWELGVNERFRRFRQKLELWNKEEEIEGLMGFPIELPSKVNDIVGTTPKFGIFILPESSSQGTLESLLLQCAEHSMPEVAGYAKQMVCSVGDDEKIGLSHRKEILTKSGNQKSQCGAIANILAPGASLAVALRGKAWLTADGLNLPSVTIVDEFLGGLLAT